MAITACAMLSPAGATNDSDAQSGSISIPATQPFAYTRPYSTCNEWCGTPNAFRIVTPFTETSGPEDWSPSWSPDATRIAFVSGRDIVVMDAAGGPITNITNTAAAEGPPAWSPDGQQIAFASNRTGEAELYLMRPDGSELTLLTTDMGVLLTRPTWSPDGNRLAFDCELDAGNQDICALGTDGTGFARLTGDLADDAGPAWSPDGQLIAFATLRYGIDWGLAVMHADGTGVSSLAGLIGLGPVWSHDGSQIAFDTISDDGAGNPVFAIYRANVDGSGVTLVDGYAFGPAWMPVLPYATFSIECVGFACTFDASDSFGAIVDYAWNFGDQATASGQTVSHTYAAGGSLEVALTVTAAGGSTATVRRTLVLNIPPVATFTVSCDESPTCVFDPAGSYDPDGWIHGATWSFGDGGGYGCGGDCLFPISHTYAAGGSYTATLRLTDNASDSATTSRTVTVPTPVMHVGDLDGSSSGSGQWSATVTIEVHNAAHGPLANVRVSASWDKGGPVSCTTNAFGRCALTRSRIRPNASARLTVAAVSHAVFLYGASSNHDPDGDSDGTTITIAKR